MRRWSGLLALLLLLPMLTASAAAHVTPNSELTIDFRDDRILIDVIIPEGDYVTASGAPGRRDRRWAAAWLSGQVAAEAPDGRQWTVRVESAEFVQRAGPPDLHALIRLTPPHGAPVRKLSLRWDAVVRQNPDHFALVLVGHDHGANVLPQDRRLIGAVRGEQRTLTIDRGAASSWAAFQASFRLGVHHIAEGTDHLLFLLSLLLPAPLVAAGRTWGGARTTGSALGQLAKVITAFTLGHSLTLLIAALGRWHLPTQPVELAIALSILVAAIHAVRPIFPGREAWVAAGFGLVHGLAFATLVSDAGVGGSDRLLSIVGFNLGIEAVQLLVAGLAIGPLMVMARTPDYRWIRCSLAGLAGLAAIAWIIERGGGIANPVAELIMLLAGQAAWLWACLVVVAGVVRTRHSWLSGSGATSGPSSSS